MKNILRKALRGYYLNRSFNLKFEFRVQEGGRNKMVVIRETRKAVSVFQYPVSSLSIHEMNE